MATERDPKFSYEPEDVILSSEPFAHVVLSDMLQIACSWCLKQMMMERLFLHSRNVMLARCLFIAASHVKERTGSKVFTRKNAGLWQKFWPHLQN